MPGRNYGDASNTPQLSLEASAELIRNTAGRGPTSAPADEDGVIRRPGRISS